MTSKQNIDRFLGLKRIAVVGVSRNASDFSRALFREFRRRGYDAVPVNTSGDSAEGLRCYTRVQEIDPPVEGALLMTPAARSEDAVRDCAAAGVRLVWLYRAAGAGAVSPAALRLCQEQGIEVVPGECPFMFFPEAGVLHRLHGFCRRITGRYPR